MHGSVLEGFALTSLGYGSGAVPHDLLRKTMANVLVLCAHPHLEHSKVNRRLKRIAQQTTGVAVRDLYALYPDYSIDVAAEQTALLAADLVVWLHPVHWYGMTPLLKLWVDETLAFGWAYGPGGTALQGKDVWLVASTGGSEAAYRPDGHNRYFFDAFLPPYEQTATLCGMRFLPPLVLHGAHKMSEQGLAEHVALFAQRLQSYPQWPELDELPACINVEIAGDQRPALAGVV
jgi:glutathione-regulated potassium-efflux system ancillary protein KefF